MTGSCILHKYLSLGHLFCIELYSVTYNLHVFFQVDAASAVYSCSLEPEFQSPKQIGKMHLLTNKDA